MYQSIFCRIGALFVLYLCSDCICVVCLYLCSVFAFVLCVCIDLILRALPSVCHHILRSAPIKVKNLHMQSVIESVTVWTNSHQYLYFFWIWIVFVLCLYLYFTCVCICVVIVLYLCCNLHMQSVMEPITPGPLPWSLTSVDSPGHLPRPYHASSQQGNLSGFPLHRCIVPVFSISVTFTFFPLLTTQSLPSPPQI